MSHNKKRLHNKYTVFRVDGRDELGEKHFNCSYFVLDITHDPHAIQAIRAYADSCYKDYPALSRDLHKWITKSMS